MRMAIIGFASGTLLLQAQAALPAVWLLWCMSLVVPPLACVYHARRHVLPQPWRVLLLGALAVSAGFAWAAWRAEWRLADALPEQWQSRDIELRGVISGLPQKMNDGWRFEFDVEHASAPVPGRVQLSWYARGARQSDETGDPPLLRPGERWQLSVRLKRPHGFSNPHGFDFEAWLLMRNLRATGYVRSSADNIRLAERVPGVMLTVHRWRDAVRARFGEMLGDRPFAGILIALAVGDQRAIPAEQWDVFRRTGVAHLVSISGLHISLVSLLFGGFAAWLWRRSPGLLLHLPVRRAAVLAGLSAAVGYAALAGLGLPTQRALLMLTVIALAMLSGREALGSRTLLIALATVLVLDPWAVLSAGFWLSFGAVAVIILVISGRRPALHPLGAAVLIQLAISFFTLPILVALFGGYPLVSPLANAIAIPLVSFAITPLVLLAIMLPWRPLLDLAHLLCEWMMWVLEWLAAHPLALWDQAAPPAWSIVAALAGAIWLLLPRGTPGRVLALLAILPMLLWAPSRPAPGEFQATLLDAGHGLAVHVATASHDLFYDSGPRYGQFSDAGERVLVPYLRASGVARLDRLVITHDDIDHTGGALSVLAAVPTSALMANLGVDHPLQHAGAGKVLGCAAGESWTWDGVRFEVLHPDADEPATRRDNDMSCVLRIVAAGGALLLTGDIESAAEQRLLRRDPGAIASDAVVVPHHGSRSSSTAAFVRATGARDALFPVGNLNAFGHPHPLVENRWRDAGARIWRTDRDGAVRVESHADGLRITPQRASVRRYWYARRELD